MTETLKHGKKKNNRISLLFIGQGGVGKTSLKKRLLGEKPVKDQRSTIGIEYEVVEVNENNKSKVWKLAADQDFIASEQYKDGIIAKQTVMRIKYESQKKLEDARSGSRSGDGGGREDEVGDGRSGNDEGKPEGGPVYVVGGVGGEGEEIEGAAGTEGSQRDEGEKNDKVERKSIEYEVLVKKIKEAMKNVKNYRDDTMDTIRFLVGDVAGQSVFYDAHSLMLKLRTLFILVVDLTKSLTAVAKPTFVDEKGKKHLGNPLKETNLDYLTRWVTALCNLKPCDGKPKTNAVKSVDQPQIIVVYTKADKLNKEEVEEKKNKVREVLHEKLKRVVSRSIIFKEFAIENKDLRSEEKLKQLRATIFETAQKMLENQEKTPVNWLVLERLLDDQKKETTKIDRPYIPFDRVKQLAKQCNVEEIRLNDAMKFFHDENIVHFQGNCDKVVLDSAWLVQLFTKVIGVSESSPPNESFAAWNDLRKKGKLDFDNVRTALDGHHKALKDMMVMAGLICPWKGNIYLVPSMVKERRKDEEIREALSNCLQPSLFLDFKDECIPLGFYTRFQVALLKWANYSERESEELQLYCNYMRVNKTENGSQYFVFLVRHISRIEFAIKSKRF